MSERRGRPSAAALAAADAIRAVPAQTPAPKARSRKGDSSAISSYNAETVKADVLAVFERAQHSSAAHGAALKRLSSLLGEAETIVSSTVVELLKRALLFLFRDIRCILFFLFTAGLLSASAPERVLHFAAAFIACPAGAEAVDDEMADRFQVAAVRFLLRALEVSDKVVRQKAAQLLAEVIQRAGASWKLRDVVSEPLLARLHDRIPQVRVFAASALAAMIGLQDEEDGDDDDLHQQLYTALECDDAPCDYKVPFDVIVTDS